MVYNKDDKLRQTQKFVRGCDVNLVDNDKNGDACKAGVAIAYDARPARTFEVAQDKHDARDAYFKHYQDEYMKGREWCTHDETNTCETYDGPAPNYYKGERDHYYVEDRCEYQKDDTTCKDVPAVRRSLSNPLARGPKAHKCKTTCKPTAKNPPLRTAKTFIPRGMKSGFSSPPEKWVNGCNTALTTTKPIEKTGEDGDAANLDKEFKEARRCHAKGTNAPGHCKWTKIDDHDQYTLMKMRELEEMPEMRGETYFKAEECCKGPRVQRRGYDGCEDIYNKDYKVMKKVDACKTLALKKDTIEELHRAEELFRGEQVFECKSDGSYTDTKAAAKAGVDPKVAAKAGVDPKKAKAGAAPKKAAAKV